jgi:uncharacterized protein (TIGR00297 family)
VFSDTPDPKWTVQVQGQQMRWQSFVVVAAVVPCCALVALRYVFDVWDGTTQTVLGISLGFTLVVLLARAATPFAALTGGIIAAVLGLAPLRSSGLASWHGSALPALITLFVLTWAATRFGRTKKQRMGVAEDKRGRNAAQVAANLGVSGLGAAFALTHPMLGEFCAVFVVAALAEATADTLASELGEVLGGPPLLLTTLVRVAPGTDGAISLAGTFAGTVGAVLVVLVAASTLGFGLRDAVCAGVGAVGGLFFDSLLGATAERRGWLNNDAVNLLSTLAAALIAIVLFLWR